MQMLLNLLLNKTVAVVLISTAGAEPEFKNRGGGIKKNPNYLHRNLTLEISSIMPHLRHHPSKCSMSNTDILAI